MLALSGRNTAATSTLCATKKTSQEKPTPAPRPRWRRIESPPEPAPPPLPPAPEWVDDVAAALRSWRPSRERDDAAEAQRARELLTTPPPFVRGQGKSGRRLARTDEPDFHGLTARVQAAVLGLDKLEGQGVVLTAMMKPKLAELVTKQAGAPISERTLRKAATYRRKHSRGLF